jgi:hypothetical protein
MTLISATFASAARVAGARNDPGVFPQGRMLINSAARFRLWCSLGKWTYVRTEENGQRVGVLGTLEKKYCFHPRNVLRHMYPPAEKEIEQDTRRKSKH